MHPGSRVEICFESIFIFFHKLGRSAVLAMILSVGVSPVQAVPERRQAVWLSIPSKIPVGCRQVKVSVTLDGRAVKRLVLGFFLS